MEFDFTIFKEQLFSEPYLHGALIALALAAAGLVLASLIGFTVALFRNSDNAVLVGVGNTYVWFFRAIPALLVLLIVWNAGPQIVPSLRDDWFTPFLAALIGFSVVEAAYTAEIFRSALLAVDEGQPLAARALGMTPPQVMLKVVLPQAIRIAIPPMGNEFISLIKFTSLATVISLDELMTTAQRGVSVTYRYAEYYAAAIVYYLVIVSILMIFQRWLEKRYEWSSKVKVSRRRLARKVAVPA